MEIKRARERERGRDNQTSIIRQRVDLLFYIRRSRLFQRRYYFGPIRESTHQTIPRKRREKKKKNLERYFDIRATFAERAEKSGI